MAVLIDNEIQDVINDIFNQYVGISIIAYETIYHRSGKER